ncbi:hypothetical protein [Levilactobacillus paucivorans]|nr:hypothetical protein [Levilactobacillus paucivorans]
MEPAVAVVLTGGLPVYSTDDFEDPRSWRGFKSSEKPGSQAEASPQQA